MAVQQGISPHGNSTRPPATGARGMVASASQHSTLAGLQVLQAGGNAVDAAVATAATLGVAEPYMSSMGGVGIGLVHIADSNSNPMASNGDGASHAGKTRVINYSGHMPNAVDADSITRAEIETGPKSALVPGNLPGWLAMHEAHGSKPLPDLFAYAIDLATVGIPLTPLMARTIADAIPNVYAVTAQGAPRPLVYFALVPGALLQQPLLAESMQRVAESGYKEFSEGALGDAIWEGLREVGGLMSREELAEYSPQWEDTISTTYRGFDVRAPGPNSSAFQILQTLNIMSGYDLEFGTADTLHLVIEAVLAAVDERVKCSGDPRFVDVPVSDLLSEERAALLREGIDQNRTAGLPPERFDRSEVENLPDAWDPGSAAVAPMTTHFATADRWGNVVTVTQTLGGGFGSCVAPRGTGVFLNNMGKWFDVRKGSPNDVAPGKAVDFVIAPTQLFADGRFVASIGTPGSYGILHTTLQMIHAFVDGGLNIQEAIEYPRFRYFDKRVLYLESRFRSDLQDGLRAKGHEFLNLPPFSNAVGGAHAIHRSGYGTYIGAADPRRDGYALGW